MKDCMFSFCGFFLKQSKIVQFFMLCFSVVQVDHLLWMMR